MNDEFYIGYEPAMPPRLAARIRRTARALVAVALALPAVLVSTQGRFAPGVFEFGRQQSFSGQIVEFPYPALVTNDATGTTRTFWLVAPGKHGAADLVRGLDGRPVQLSGSRIERDQEAMIEVAAGTITLSSKNALSALEPLRSVGIVSAEGEIVDSKCHLGVMKPGDGPTHRDCAVRCLLGQIPPMFVARRPRGIGRVSLVTDSVGPFLDASTWAGRRIALRGEILQRGDQRFLAVARRDIRVLD